MHLEGPWLSTTGRKRGPKKWASAEAKHKAEQRKTDWELKLKEFDRMKPRFSNRPAPKRKTDWSMGAPKVPPGRETVRVASQDTGWVACTTAPNQSYTGSAVVGIAVQHKSCLQPVFSQEAAIESAKMRR
jgi:hypothetical protein